jgi:PAS domain-containing protein
MIERHATEEKAYLQQRCAEVTLACTGNAVIISNSLQRVTHLNGPAELLTGWSQAEARGHSLNEYWVRQLATTKQPQPSRLPWLLVHTKIGPVQTRQYC